MIRIPSNSQQIELLMIMEDTRFFCDMAHEIIPQKSTGILIFDFSPYISLFVMESYKYLQQRIPNLAQLAKNEHESITRSSRTMVKLFDEHLRDLTEITKSIEWLIQYHNDLFMKKHKGLLAGLKRLLQDDLGLYFYDRHLISTTHLAFFNIGFNKINIEKYGDGFETMLSTISHEIGMIAGKYIKIMCTIFNIDVDEVRRKHFNYTLEDTLLGFIDKKAEKYYPDIFNGPSTITLNFCLLLCEATVNFINYILKITINTPITFFKFKFITLYHLTASLKRLQNFFYPQELLNDTSKDCFKEILSNKELRSFLTKSDFRNTLVHYNLANFPVNTLDLDIKLYGLVEYFFNKITFEELNSCIDAQFVRIGEILTKWHYLNTRHNNRVQPKPLARL